MHTDQSVTEGSAIYRAAFGRRVAYATAAEALEYDRGYAAYPARGPTPEQAGSPYENGWFHAESVDEYYEPLRGEE